MTKLLRAAALCLLPLLSACSSCSRSKTEPGTSGDSGTTHLQTAVNRETKKQLTAFKDQADLDGFIRDLREARQRDQMPRGKGGMEPAPAAAAPMEESAADKAESSEGESVTNVQHAGVDEGGIVKLHQGHLIVLRRGRLFTIRIDDGALTPVSEINAFGPDTSPRGAWYDEMLVSGSTIVVVGYSYQRGGTELGIFDMAGDGKLSYRATYHLRSNDYYSSRNYASRLIGNKLIFYSPLYLHLDERRVNDSFPALRRWRAGATPADFKRIVTPQRIYRPLIASSFLALHTVTTCDLGARELDCTATSVMGPAGRVFYVSPSAVYVWMTHWERDAQGRAPRSLVYRMPLDGAAPSALHVKGTPIDQMSFLEGEGHLNVVVRADGGGEAMWRSEVKSGDMALLRVPLTSFGPGEEEAPSESYATLPRPLGYAMQNRFVGDYVLYGTGTTWGRPRPAQDSNIYAYRYAGGGPTAALPLPHGVDRIEALGRDAVAVGSDGSDLYFTPVVLGDTPALRPAYKRTGASQGETRSHGFFYKPQGDGEGLLGLPIVGGSRPGHRQLREGSASILFLKNVGLSFSELGTLEARPGVGQNDGCQASCVDWYGNARPLFFQNRIVALLGYELVEGTLDDAKLFEKRRTSFAPEGNVIAR
ncbi:MAG: beta-propeller domain-containing protein [Polyangiaceae bacterium]